MKWMLIISEKGEIFLPKELLNHFNLVPGSVLKMEVKNEQIILYPPSS